MEDIYEEKQLFSEGHLNGYIPIKVTSQSIIKRTKKKGERKRKKN